MSDVATYAPAALHRYLLMWNELDPEKIRGHLDQSVATDCLWVDPQHSHVGRDALEENVRGFRKKFGDVKLELASNVDGHNNRYRYEWAITQNGEVIFPGFDVVTLNEEGLIERVDGFFGVLEPLAAS